MTSTGVVARRARCLVARVGVLAGAVSPGIAGAQGIPTAEALLARHEAAIGGRAALDAHSSLRMTGSIRIAVANLHGRVEILKVKPSAYLRRYTIDGIGELMQGADSSIAWSIEPSGAALLTGDDARAVRLEADWYSDLLSAPAMRAGRVDSTEFEGVPAWRVTFATELGAEARVYYARDTGLRLGESRASSRGEMVSIQSEYREFGGVRIATLRVTRADLGESVIRIDGVEFDTVRPDEIALPPAIKAIIR